ncbi:AMP-binding protein [Kribbia dieselivorans]|uniref:AMP-binding protein n=1 Tax=Kribbia dieselivorans TaxID=331526 RepID=UPI0008385F1E|nr:AMP-binding protein [Kribbia dieselivorans]
MKPDLSLVDPLQYNLAGRVNLGDQLSRVALMFPDRIAVVDGDREVTYRELRDTAQACARGLLARGLQHQQPVSLLMGNSVDFLATFFGCATSGLVAMPVNVVLAPDDIAWILNDAESTTVVADAPLIPLLEAVLPNTPAIRTVIVRGEAPAAIAGRAVQAWADLAATPGDPVEVVVDDRDTVQCLYTSGTTARPKGVLISHTSLTVSSLSNALGLGTRWGSEPTVLANVLPLFHTTALNTLVMPVLFLGGTVVLASPFVPGDFLDLIEQRRVTTIMLLPMMYAALVAEQRAHPRDLSSVTMAVYGMAPMGTELLDAVDAAFPNAAVILGSGQTECIPATVLQWPEHRHSASDSWGPAAPTVAARIMDPTGDLCPAGETGEIVYRGPHVMSGYWNNATANATAFAHGWFHSSDIGHVDDAGVVWFTDRLKDIIKTGGENVSSVAVERVVLGAPGVAEATIIGVPDDRWGEAVCAVVVADATVDPATLPDQVIAHAKSHLAGFQVPKKVLVVDAMPKTATGKVQKHVLRASLRG